jgi:lipopolysaccharide transport system permease protein
VALAISLWRNRQLIVQMTKREVVGRYQGSAMGLVGLTFDQISLEMLQ